MPLMLFVQSSKAGCIEAISSISYLYNDVKDLLKSSQGELKKTKQKVLENRFEVTRELKSYNEAFGRRFEQLIESPNQVWIDWGAGLALAQRQADGPQLIAVSFSKPKVGDKATEKTRDKLISKDQVADLESDIKSGRLHYIEGDASRPMHLKIQATIATDYWGAITYTPDLTATLINVFDSLAVNGSYFFKDGTKTSIVRSGKWMSIADFLKQVPGLVVINLSGQEFQVIKKSSKIDIPQLSLKRWRAETPPDRLFQVNN